MEVYERIRRGTIDNGIKIRKDKIFQVVVDTSGIIALRESAKRTTSATL